MQVSVLVENEPSIETNDLIPEFGLSLHIDTGDRRIGFDTGTVFQA